MRLYKSRELSINKVEVIFYDYIFECYEQPVIYYAPLNGGFVRYGKNGNEICENMQASGQILEWNGKGRLIDFIRKELKKYSNLYKKYSKI